MVPEPFIRIFSTINRAQFESINEKYKGQQLIKDITSKLGGDFEQAVLTMCADRYEFFAKKVEKCLKGYSADKDGLCRWEAFFWDAWQRHLFLSLQIVFSLLFLLFYLLLKKVIFLSSNVLLAPNLIIIIINIIIIIIIILISTSLCFTLFSNFSFSSF